MRERQAECCFVPVPCLNSRRRVKCFLHAGRCKTMPFCLVVQDRQRNVTQKVRNGVMKLHIQQGGESRRREGKAGEREGFEVRAGR